MPLHIRMRLLPWEIICVQNIKYKLNLRSNYTTTTITVMMQVVSKNPSHPHRTAFASFHLIKPPTDHFPD